MKHSTFTLALFLAAAFAWTASADLTPVAFTGYTANNNGNAQTIGYEFSVSQAITVTALSYFDNGNDGLLSAHTVGLFDAGGNTLASVTILPTANGSGDINGFYHVALTTTVVLTPGNNYFVGGTSGGTGGLDSYAQAATGVTFGQGITYLAAVYAADPTPANTLTFPSNIDQFGAGYGFYGGSFLYTVPEPSVLATVLAGGALPGLVIRRRRRSA